MHQSAIDVDVFLLSHLLHGALAALADEAPLFFRRLAAAPLAEKLADLLREDGEAGLEVVAALMNMYVASTAEEDLKSLLDPLRRDPVERHKADIAIGFQDVLKRRLGGHLLLNLRSH